MILLQLGPNRFKDVLSCALIIIKGAHGYVVDII